LGKPMMLIPMPNTHQEANAKILADTNSAIVLRQTELTGDIFAKVVGRLLDDAKLIKQLSTNANKVMPLDAEVQMAKIVLEIMANIK
jgi:UDP-N-acetylglucosamine:LPS N-acetylglucosamine transferase